MPVTATTTTITQKRRKQKIFQCFWSIIFFLSNLTFSLIFMLFLCIRKNVTGSLWIQPKIRWRLVFIKSDLLSKHICVRMCACILIAFSESIFLSMNIWNADNSQIKWKNTTKNILNRVNSDESIYRKGENVFEKKTRLIIRNTVGLMQPPRKSFFKWHFKRILTAINFYVVYRFEFMHYMHGIVYRLCHRTFLSVLIR